MYVYIFLAEHPFLNVSYRNERASTVVVPEGRKRLVFEPKVNALPRAELTAWYEIIFSPLFICLSIYSCITQAFSNRFSFLQVQGWGSHPEKFHLQDIQLQPDHQRRAAQARRRLHRERGQPGGGLAQEPELHAGRQR